jgi:hypothetical protein
MAEHSRQVDNTFGHKHLVPKVDYTLCYNAQGHYPNYTNRFCLEFHPAVCPNATVV